MPWRIRRSSRQSRTSLTGTLEYLGKVRKILSDCVALETAKSRSRKNAESAKAWFQQYLNWLLTSSNGRKESNAQNNHGSWYDVQAVSMGLYVGNRELAVHTLQNSKFKRIARQIEPDGRQPLELARTRSWTYSVFNLQALFGLAALGDSVGVDLWHFQPSGAGGLRVALDYLIPFGLGEKKWPYQQITTWDTKGLVSLLRQVAIAYNNAAYVDASMKLVASSAGLENLIYPWPNS